MQDNLRKLRSIVNDATLNPAQKARYLSLEAENLLPYPSLDAETRQALDERVICDMYEGHAPHKPRYVLPDYGVVLQQGSEYLELPVPATLDEAINTLMIAYHHVPSVTGMPVYIGQLDELLLPFCAGVSDDELYDKAVAIVARDRKCSTSYIQRKLAIGYNKAARLVEQMEDQGVVTSANQVGKREILIEER